MSSLVERLYPLPATRRTPLSLLAWWESRRLLYNQVVGATGLVTLTGLFVAVPDRADLFAPPLLGAVIVYGLAANLCYTLGWVTEVAAWALWGREAPRMGPLLFRQGLIFAAGLTLLPLLVALFVLTVRTLLVVLGLVF